MPVKPVHPAIPRGIHRPDEPIALAKPLFPVLTPVEGHKGVPNSMNLDQLRAIALSLPETSEAPHHGRTSFRVKGKIFATAPPDGSSVNIFVDEHAVRTAAATNPGCSEVWWGKRLAGVQVRLDDADEALVAELLTEAWRAKAGRDL